MPVNHGSETIWKYVFPLACCLSSSGIGKDMSQELSPFKFVNMGRNLLPLWEKWARNELDLMEAMI